ncbi:MAG: hypothetical protein ACN4GT_15155, partial [Gammaproteobacteria bacterium]
GAVAEPYNSFDGRYVADPKRGCGERLLGTWYLSLAGCLLLVMVGMYIHWSVVVIGLLLPFLPMLSFVLARRTERRRDSRNSNAAGRVPAGEDRGDQP